MLHEFFTGRTVNRQRLWKLKASKVAVYGIGGVGSFWWKGLVRAGRWKVRLVDDDWCV